MARQLLGFGKNRRPKGITVKVKFKKSDCTENGCCGKVGELWAVAVITGTVTTLAYSCDKCGRLYESPIGGPLDTKTGLRAFCKKGQGIAKDGKGRIIERFCVVTIPTKSGSKGKSVIWVR